MDGGTIQSGAGEMLLVLQWPIGVCRAFSGLCQWANSPQYIETFTIHGLWPQGMVNPFSTENFNLSQVSALPLSVVWPSVLTTYTNEGFWAHEWDVHGKFQNTVLSGSMLDYFQHTVDMASRFDIVGALSHAGNIF